MKRSLIILSIVLGFYMSNASAEPPWHVVYQTDFSSDPGWTTNAPSDMYWDQSKGAYHLKLTDCGDQYTFVEIPYLSSASYKLEFDIRVVRLDWAATVLFGLGDSDMHPYEPATWGANYGRGDGGNGATVHYFGDSSSGRFPGGYDFLFEFNTDYHNVIVYDRNTESLSWQVTRISDGAIVADYSASAVSSFTGIDRLYSGRVGYCYAPGATGEAYIDNVVLCATQPELPCWAYFNDFEGVVESEWSNTSTDMTPGTVQHSADRFLGQFGNSATVNLTLNNLPSHNQLRVSFDLYLIRTWDGDAGAGGGGIPDNWSLEIEDSLILFNETFSNCDWTDPESTQTYGPDTMNAAYTDSDEMKTLGYEYHDAAYDGICDSVYRLSFLFDHSADSIVLNFSDSLDQSLSDESWGLDNVKVELVCEPEPEWSFVHLTDTHIGWPGARGKLAVAIHEINHSAQAADFILVTGDIVENAWFSTQFVSIRMPFYRSYVEALRSVNDDTRVYTVPGNHDRYVYSSHFPFVWSSDLSVYDDYIEQPEGTDDLIPPHNYSFEHRGLTVVGLDSGEDVLTLPPPFGDFNGVGLSAEQMSVLQDENVVDPVAPKIIFMHHPAVNTNNTWSIANNRSEFIGYCEDNNVQLVLAGHTHEDHTYDVNGVMYVQTPSATKDEDAYKHGYRTIDVQGSVATPRPYSPTEKHKKVKAALSSPGNVHIYDSNGRHVGVLDSDEAELGIPDSFYFSHYVVPTEDGNQVFPEEIIIFDPCDAYIYQVVGTESGTYLLEIGYGEDGNEVVFEANGIPTTPNEVHEYVIDWDALSQGEDGATLRVDRDGDGDYERTITSDGLLTSDEFDAPCVVQIIVPNIDQALQDGVTLTAEANDGDGIDSVYFYIREPNDGNGAPIGYEELPATLNGGTGQWEYPFDTTVLLDGYYVILAKAVDTYSNEGWSEVVPFSIRNWAIVELLPASANNKAGRTMPVKFSLRIAEAVDPAMPFVYNEDLEIRIISAGSILQTSLYGDTSADYRINSTDELYITNFKIGREPAEYTVEIWRTSKDFCVGSFTFKTVK